MSYWPVGSPPELTPAQEYAYEVRMHGFDCEECGKRFHADEKRTFLVDEDDDNDAHLATVCVGCRDELESAAGDRAVAARDKGIDFPFARNH